MTEILIAFSLAAAVFLLFIFLSSNGTPDSANKKSETAVNEYSKLPCILCGSKLKKGERLKSEKFTSADKSIVHIFGCPYCQNDINKEKKCPVCKRKLNHGEFLTADMWKKENGKNRLHVRGCVKCAGR